MMRRLALGIALGSCVLLTAAATAQTSVVSPAGFAARDGSMYEFWPWIDVGRRQQVHGDLRGQPLPITAIAWRRDGGRGVEPKCVARTLDAEVGIGAADYAAVGNDVEGRGRRLDAARRRGDGRGRAHQPARRGRRRAARDPPVFEACDFATDVLTPETAAREQAMRDEVQRQETKHER